MKFAKPLIALLGAFAFASAANAAVLTSSSGNAVTDYSSAGVVSFDLDLADFSQTTLNYVVQADDLLGNGIGLSALLRNFSGLGLERVNFSLSGISYAAAGSVTPTFGTLGHVGYAGTNAVVQFSSPEWAEFHFGNPLSVNGQSDWLLSTSGLQAGDTFSITATVPEPGSVAMMLSGLLLMAYAQRRKDKR